MREGRTEHLTSRERAIIVTDALLSEGKEASEDRVKTGFMQNAKWLLTGSVKTCRKLY